MENRSAAVTQSLASARLEGMEPSPQIVERLQAWSRGELSDGELDRRVEQLVAAARADVATVRAAA